MNSLRRAASVAAAVTAPGAASFTPVPAPPQKPVLIDATAGISIWNALYGVGDPSDFSFCVLIASPTPSGPVRLSLYDMPHPASRPRGDVNQLELPVIRDEILTPLFNRIWEHYGDECCVVVTKRGGVWAASRNEAMNLWLARRPPVDSTRDRFALPKPLMELIRRIQIFRDSDDPLLNAIGASLCLFSGFGLVGVIIAWVMFAVETLAEGLGELPITAGHDPRIYVLLSVTVNLLELITVALWNSPVANRFGKPLMALDLGYHFYRGFLLGTVGPVTLDTVGHTVQKLGTGLAVITTVPTLTITTVGRGGLNGVLSVLFALGPQLLIVLLVVMCYELWPLVRVWIPSALRLRKAQMATMHVQAQDRVNQAQHHQAPRWMIDNDSGLMYPLE